jgi:hypothetical protein
VCVYMYKEKANASKGKAAQLVRKKIWQLAALGEQVCVCVREREREREREFVCVRERERERQREREIFKQKLE